MEIKSKTLIKSKESESYSFEEVEVKRDLDENEVLIKMTGVALCGSDIPLFKWDEKGRSIANIPFCPGHECCGTIVSVGSLVDASRFNVGDLVCVETHLPCEKCWQCLHDKKGICANMGLFGHGVKTQSGGCSQFSTAPSSILFKLHRHLPPHLACLLEPFGVAHNACEEADLVTELSDSETLLVTGAGSIGLFCCIIAKKAMGIGKVIVADISDKRLELAKQLGVVDFSLKSSNDPQELVEKVLDVTDGVGVGKLIECSGAASVVNSSFKMVRKGGNIVFVGLLGSPIHIEEPIKNFLFKALTIRTIHGRKMFHTWEQAEELLSREEIQKSVENVITHRYPLSHFEDAFQALISGEACKIVMDPQQ